METFAGRLASFNVSHTTTKKRTSNAKGAGKLKWPHKSPHPAQLARAGFFYNPTSATPDNTTCYLCRNNLDGWEEDDSAIGEHLNFASDCGWAAIVRIEQEIEVGNLDQQDPMDEHLLNARKMTFDAGWPHEDKRGWVCKTQKMIEAGWYYCPTPESDDFVKCCYCNLSLDGWEPKDNPYDEHQRRSPDCVFFALSQPRGKKTARGKRSRASKASRISTQSNLTAAYEDISMVDANIDRNEIATTSIDKPGLLGSPEDTKGANKAVKGKRGAPKTKRKGSAAQPAESVPDSSFVEPEDDDFEVKVELKSHQRRVGEKRRSDEMSVDDEEKQPEVKQDNQLPQIPTTKRRATRSSVPHANMAASSVLDAGQTDDTVMTDAETIHPPRATISKKAPKGGKRKASSSARKASTTSAASKASLRATIPDDEEIDAALEVDLDRPLTDDEVEQDPPAMPMGKSRRLTRTRPGSRNVTASTAPVRRATRASALPVEGDSMASNDDPANDIKDDTAGKTKAVEIALTAMDHAKQEIVAETDKYMGSEARTRSRGPSKPVKSTKKGKETKKDGDIVSSSEHIYKEPVGQDQPPKVPKTQRSSFQSSRNTHRTSDLSIQNNQGERAGEINSSLLEPSVAYENCGMKPNDGKINPSHLNGGPKPRSAAARKGKASKRGAAASHHQTDVRHIEAEEAKSNDLVVLVEVEMPEDQVSVEEPKLSVVASAKEPPQSGSEGGKRMAAKSKRSDTIPPPGASSSTQAEPIEVQPVKPHHRDAGSELPTPEDYLHVSPEVSVRSPTPSAQVPSEHQTPKAAHSPQSSDAENQPPSARPSALRPPLLVQTPSKSQTPRVLAAATPTASPSKRNISRLQSTLPWISIDIDKLFNTPSADKENLPSPSLKDPKQGLSSPEKKLTVEEWVRWNAERGEDKLREKCERLVGKFESEGVRALKTLEGIICAE
ncbi:MAG: hypothetical protein Q9184_002161 [Pyrenodesmia sp. 2 TL-2023]